MKNYLLSIPLCLLIAGGSAVPTVDVLAKSPSKHDDVVVDITLPAAPAPAPTPVVAAEPTPIIINNTATATNNNYPINTNDIDMSLISSITDLIKEMSADSARANNTKSKAYSYGNYDYNDYSYGTNDYSNYDWEAVWTKGRDEGREEGWEKGWDSGWSEGWDAGWADGITFAEKNGWDSTQIDWANYNWDTYNSNESYSDVDWDSYWE